MAGCAVAACEATPTVGIGFRSPRLPMITWCEAHAELFAGAGRLIGRSRVDEAVGSVEGGAGAGERWLVRAAWENSADTFHGGFASSESAGSWAGAHLAADDACVSWIVELLLHVSDGVAW
jgi:hypothetical protein